MASVTGNSTNWFENLQRLELWRVIFSGIFPTRVENWFEFAGVSNNRGFEKSGVKLQCLIERSKSKGNDNWFELSGGSRNRGFEKSGFHCAFFFLILVIVYCGELTKTNQMLLLARKAFHPCLKPPPSRHN